jgi:hypothetical protein
MLTLFVVAAMVAAAIGAAVLTECIDAWQDDARWRVINGRWRRG